MSNKKNIRFDRKKFTSDFEDLSKKLAKALTNTNEKLQDYFNLLQKTISMTLELKHQEIVKLKSENLVKQQETAALKTENSELFHQLAALQSKITDYECQLTGKCTPSAEHHPFDQH